MVSASVLAELRLLVGTGTASLHNRRERAIAAAIPIKGNRQNFIGEVLNDLLTPDTRKLDFSPMGSGTAKTARESMKSPEGTLGLYGVPLPTK